MKASKCIENQILNEDIMIDEKIHNEYCVHSQTRILTILVIMSYTKGQIYNVAILIGQ